MGEISRTPAAILPGEFDGTSIDETRYVRSALEAAKIAKR